MGTVGDSYDNALAESVNGLYKAELIHSKRIWESVEAVELAQGLDPDVILLDWNMPVMDGFEFLVQLRRMAGGDVPKVVFCTTENGIDHISRALHAGANEYIMKPFDKDIVIAKFQEVGLLALDASAEA